MFTHATNVYTYSGMVYQSVVSPTDLVPRNVLAANCLLRSSPTRTKRGWPSVVMTIIQDK